MKRSRFTETQIISILKEAETGMAVKDACRKHGISSPTYYKWKAKYGGLDASKLKRMKELESEVSQYKRMYAELAHENYALKELIEKNSRAVGETPCRGLSGRPGPFNPPVLPKRSSVSFRLVSSTPTLLEGGRSGHRRPE